MTQGPGNAEPRRDETLTYATPVAGGGKNRWWMIMLRILGGMGAAAVSAWLGAWIAGMTNTPILFFLPPGVVFAAFVVLTVKYRRFGYLSGFVLAPFVAFVAAIVMLAIVCGIH